MQAAQSSEIMASYGVNVPPGVPVFKLDEVLPAAKKMADDSGQVIEMNMGSVT
jgi:succinyl-CoA synthetase beta subunit